MAVRRIWLVSIANRSILYTKCFPIVEVKAKQLALPFVPALRGVKDEQEFVSALFCVLGIDGLAQSNLRRDSLVGDDPNSEELDFDNRKVDADFDCSLKNQLPVVEMVFKEVKLWPILVIEHGGILFCALPLVDTSSRDLIDHISVSIAFSALQAIIKHFARENVRIAA